MSRSKTVIPREKARQDVEAAADYYQDEAGPDVALDFIDALQAAYQAIATRPGIGSTRYAAELDLPELRCRKLKRFPYLVFYIERADHLDVWRVLHARRDIPARFEEK